MKFIFYVPNISIAEWIGLVISFFGTIATCIIAGYNIYFQKKIKKDEKRYRNEKFVEAIRMIAVKTDVIYQNLPQNFKSVFRRASRSEDPIALLNDEHLEKLDTQISDLKDQLNIERKLLLSHLKKNKNLSKITILEGLFVYMKMTMDIFKDITYYIYYLDQNKIRLDLDGFIKLANSKNKYPTINADNIDRNKILEIIHEKIEDYYTEKNKTIDPQELIFSLNSFGINRLKSLEKLHNDIFSDYQIYKELDSIVEEI